MVVLFRDDIGVAYMLERDGSVTLDGIPIFKNAYSAAVKEALKTPRQVGTHHGVPIYRTPRGALAVLQPDGSFKRLSPAVKAAFTGQAAPRRQRGAPRGPAAVPKRLKNIRPVCAAQTSAARPKFFNLAELKAYARQWVAKRPNHPEAARIVAAVDSLKCSAVNRAAVRSAVRSAAAAAGVNVRKAKRKRAKANPSPK